MLAAGRCNIRTVVVIGVAAAARVVAMVVWIDCCEKGAPEMDLSPEKNVAGCGPANAGDGLREGRWGRETETGSPLSKFQLGNYVIC